MTLTAPFSFACPTKIHVGDGALDHLPYELGCLDVTRPLVLTGRSFVDLGLLRALMGGLAGFGDCGVCDEIPDRLTEEDIDRLAAVSTCAGADGLLALGSGPVVETAKRLKALIDGQAPKRPMPLVVVPCIHGSRGLECAGWIGSGPECRMSTALMPVLAVIDARTLPPAPFRETALAAMAGLCLALEAALSACPNPLTDTYAEAALGELRRFLSVGPGRRDQAAGRLSLAAALAMAGCGAVSQGQGLTQALGRAAADVLAVDRTVAAAVVMNASLIRAAETHGPRMARLLWPVAGIDAVAVTPPDRQAAAAAQILSGWFTRLLSAVAPDDEAIREALADPAQRAAVAAAAAAGSPGAAGQYGPILDALGAAPAAALPVDAGCSGPAPIRPQRPGYYEFGCRVRIEAGPGMLERIPALLADLGAGRPMVLTDRGVAAAGLSAAVIQALGDGVSVGAIVDEVPPDSDLAVVNALADRYRETGCDAIVAVGGGSVLDTAKGINIVVGENARDLMRYTGAGNLKHPLSPLIAVPTTAGTGSEVTQAAVIADPVRHRKMLFSSYFLQPDAAVLDPRMTLTLPAAITAATGMDALTHAVESYYCLARNPLSDAAILAAVELISRHLRTVVAAPGDKAGRLALAVAATLAGVAFSNAPVGLVHTMGHSVGSVCGVPHGVCMAIGLPYGIEYNLHKIGPLAGDLLLPMVGVDRFAAIAAADRPAAAIAWIRKLNQDLNAATGGRHPTCFKEVMGPGGRPAVPRERLPEIAAVALGDGTQVYNPEDLDEGDYLMVLEAAWEGKPLAPDRVRRG